MAQQKTQIDQMVNFILQEAHEKANEIRVKTEHDFNLEKQMMVHNAKQRINSEYEQKERDREVQQRIAKSNQITKSRVEKMEAREVLVNDLMATAMAQINTIPSTPQYPSIVKDLLVQAFIKIEESDLEVCCRADDAAVIQQAIGKAVAECKQKTGKVVNASFNGSKVIPSQVTSGIPSGPGVVVIAQNGSIVCDNTLGARLTLCFQEQTPVIRTKLFGARGAPSSS
eukprot:CAMPEP_0205922142 /NCGR_PEP_ID=MMETSP1325-20131115/13995_1 /ASSEMBLY_ACC=CAM_ASM_000708 /TAXON_ID=236786 /ORGANISM="Florenciella sp., Strain RCC1007" /LENGTH=226 /DNA_ID=CAMNT_0053290109 /DNA_START=82 /DNA_END=762 /DNA_ORIENTATION=-